MDIKAYNIGMRKFLFLIALLVVGCADKSPVSKSNYPVTAQYAAQKPVFVLNECGGVYDMACMNKWADFFGHKLLDHYNQWPQAISVCGFNINLCMNPEIFEEHVRDYGKI